ncbi:MAG: hypothetical protein JNM72_13810 [Deltaproteobacteria bacterium]|jgi:hypothetical protein|nr:hypothetical protein [Deltaproteobacteria bacterium]
MSPRLAALLLALAALLTLRPRPAAAQACQAVVDVPEGLQVAWVSPMGRRVRAGATIEVVRVQDLRKWVRDHGADSARLVQGMGMAPRWGGRRAKKEYKVVIFDVQADWMCRPMGDVEAGKDVGGVIACDGREGGRIAYHRSGYTGCGYSLDTGASTRGLDVFRVKWSDASTWGFCTMPLERFIKGA